MQTQTIAFPHVGSLFAELEVLVGLSRSTLHRMVAGGELETVTRGRRRLMPARERTVATVNYGVNCGQWARLGSAP
jgi:hypothetical protein